MVLGTEQVSDLELDEQQAQLLDVLRRFGGKPASYQQLRDAGIEYPASVVSELELAGLPLERAYEGSLSARRLLGVRLDPRYERVDAEPQTSGSSWTAPAPLLSELRSSIHGGALRASTEAHLRRALRAIASLVSAAARAARPYVSRAARSIARAFAGAGARTRRELGRALRSLRPARSSLRLALRSLRLAPGSAQAPRPRPPVPVKVRAPRAPMRGGGVACWRWLAPAALITAAALVAAIVAGGGAGGGAGGAGARAHRSPSAHQAKLGAARAAPNASTSARAPQRRAPDRPSTPVSPSLAAQLEARGHALLQEAQFAGAISVLRQAVAATGEKLESCLEPSSETCLTYAYALYDLGRALRLDRQPGTAVPILERRLQIDNQREAVQTELELARREAGGQAPGSPRAT
jgi:tetratricopeptide (TPR) repeat protein